MIEESWRKLVAQIKIPQKAQKNIDKTNSSVVSENHQAVRKESQIEILASAIIRYLDWQSLVLENKEKRRNERFRQAWIRKHVDK